MRSSPKADLNLPALAASSVLIIALVLLTRQMVSLPNEHASRLTTEVFDYSLLLLFTVTAMIYTGCDAGLKGAGNARSALLPLGLALGVVLLRFFLKQPPTSWQEKAAGDWLLISEGYLVGRLLVPVFEELLFRGLFWSALAGDSGHSGWRPNLPTLVTAAVFGALHWPGLYGQPTDGGWIIVLSAFVGGVVFGVLRQRTGSIYAGLALHIVGNSIGF